MPPRQPLFVRASLLEVGGKAGACCCCCCIHWMQLGCHEPICIQLYVKQAQVSTRMCDVSTRSGLVQPLLWRRVGCKHAVLLALLVV